MKIKHLMPVLALAVSLTASAQTDVVSLLGKPVSDAQVTAFVGANKLDANTGLSYANGVQVFHDGQTVYEISLFNATTLNGNPVQAYKGPLPYNITFKDTPEVLNTRFGMPPGEKKGEHLVWDMKDHQVEIAFTDDKKTEIAYILLEKK